MNTQIANTSSFSLSPSNLNEAMQLAELMAGSEMVPKDFKGKPGNVLVAVQMGAEVGLAPMQAIQNIAVINGRPSLWGDAVKAIILSSPLCEKFEESFNEQTMTASTTIKRKGHAEVTTSFSQADAELAGLWNKSGPWTQYPKRMLKMRSRGFAARDEFADVLKGLSVAEEQEDIVREKDITPMHPPEVTNDTPSTKPKVSDSEKLNAIYVRGIRAIENGKKSAADILAFISEEGLLISPEKEAMLHSTKKVAA
jgi:hypothetical protein